MERQDMKALRTHASLVAPLLVAAGLLLNVSPTSAAPAQIWHKKGGFVITLMLYTGGWGSTGPEYMWIEYVPNTVMKDQKDGSIFIHDCDNSATISIGTGDGSYSPPGEVFYAGTCSIVLEGLWALDPETGWFLPSDERMNWHIMATVFDTEEDEWTLYWQFVMRDGEWNETYYFEPAN
jgi:hypothetical protein